MSMRASDSDGPRIVVVGPCGSGKTTLVDHLRERGYDARVVAQEHSIIRDLWQKRDPDVIVALDLDLATLRARRSPTWSAEIFALQHERLKEAFAAADLIINTAEHDEEDVVALVTAFLESAPEESV